MHAKTKEFIWLFNVSGWSQAEVARQLSITRGAVSQLRSGKTRPHQRTLDLFRLIVTRLKQNVLRISPPDRVSGSPGWAVDLIRSFGKLSEEDRQRILPTIKQMIKVLQLARRHRRSQRGR